MRSAHCRCRPISARQCPGAAATARGCSRRERRTDAGRRLPPDGEARSHRSSFVGLGCWTSLYPPLLVGALSSQRSGRKGTAIHSERSSQKREDESIGRRYCSESHANVTERSTSNRSKHLTQR